MAALESLGKLDDPMFGNVLPDDTVNLYFNLSKDEDGDIRGPWNEGGAVEYLADPKPQGQAPDDPVNPDDEKSVAGSKQNSSGHRTKKAARAR